MKEIIQEALLLSDGVEPHWLERKRLSESGKEKTRKAFLVDNLVELTQDGEISWLSHGDDLSICRSDEHTFVLRKKERYLR